MRKKKSFSGDVYTFPKVNVVAGKTYCGQSDVQVDKFSRPKYLHDIYRHYRGYNVPQHRQTPQ